MDPVHASIENGTSKQEIFPPTEGYEAVRNAKINDEKYRVIEIKGEDIKDFRTLAGMQKWDQDQIK